MCHLPCCCPVFVGVTDFGKVPHCACQGYLRAVQEWADSHKLAMKSRAFVPCHANSLGRDMPFAIESSVERIPRTKNHFTMPMCHPLARRDAEPSLEEGPSIPWAGDASVP